MQLAVQTASWFGVDRIEVYVNGHLAKEFKRDPQPGTIVDFSDDVVLDVPQRQGDSWIVVIAAGFAQKDLMRPVSLDVPYGEIQLSKVTADAFALIPVVYTFFSAAPSVPDWGPIPPYAVSNPIYLDTDHNGKYDAPLPYPVFCSQPCDPNGAATCPGVPGCITDDKDPSKGLCGYGVTHQCTHRVPWPGG
jgi:hypothetical protein